MTHPIVLACVALGVYGVIYSGGTAMLGVAEARGFVEAVRARVGLVWR